MSETGQAAGAAPDTVPDLEQLLLDPTRLTIVSLVSATTWCEFAFVRDHARLSDSALSKQLTTLGNAKLVEIRKGYVGKRPRTWFKLTPEGRHAFDEYVTSLQKIVGRPLADIPEDR